MSNLKCGLAALLLLCVCAITASAQRGFFPDEAISQPRFASGDVDGDGRDEIIAGGRVGHFMPVDAPLFSRRARVDVYRQAGPLLRLVGRAPELHAVEDMTTGDVDGDGRAEIIAVGFGRLILLTWRKGGLSVHRMKPLALDWTDRVAAGDLDGDGRAEVAVTLYDIDADAEMGRTQVIFYRWQGNAFEEWQALDVPFHVGDLALGDLDGVGGQELLLETGAGEEGGDARLYHWQGGRCKETWRGPVTDGGRRALNLSIRAGSPGLVAAGATNGGVRLYRFDGNGLRLMGRGPEGPPLGSLLLLPESGQGAGLLIGPGGTGQRGFRIAPISF